jgi:tetrathionate reductase subunit B
MKVFVFDTSICNGCYCCQIACKDEHCGNDWIPYARPQPDTGQFWLKLSEHVRGTVPKVKVHYLPVLCNHCDSPTCLTACPVEGAIYKREDGLVIIDPERCTGCSDCATACPYHAIYMNDDLNVAQKCTGCAHLLDSGWRHPRCVDACPTLALKFMEEPEALDLIGRAEVMHPEYEQRPRVYYLNVPRRFIAGTIYDPVQKEVVIGATCVLTGHGDGDVAGRGGVSRSTTTDGFGDFWYEGLSPGLYTLSIDAEGFAPKTFPAVDAEEDVNLGDIPLDR